MAALHIENGKITLEKTDGTFVNLSFFDEVGPLSWGHFWFKIGDHYGYMNELGEIIAKAKYKYAGNFDRTGHAPVGNDIGKGFIDQNGVEVCPLIYEEVWYFNNNFAKVKRNNSICYINLLGLENHLPYVERIWESKTIR